MGLITPLINSTTYLGPFGPAFYPMYPTDGDWQNMLKGQLLRSVSCHRLFVPCRWRSTFGRQTFLIVAAQTVWNSL